MRNKILRINRERNDNLTKVSKTNIIFEPFVLT